VILATKAIARQRVDGVDLKTTVGAIMNRHPAVGLAMGIVRDGRLVAFHGGGLADVHSHTQVTEDTFFRIASVTKTFTAIAVMQLVERGLLELDRPANDYLRAFQLVPARASFGQPTLRHLLTHTAAIREALHLTDLLRFRDMGSTIKVGRHIPSLAELYRGGLRFDSEPGSRFMYTNHGFGALGEVVEEVSGQPLPLYFREHLFKPLGMDDSSLLLSDVPRSRFATAYELRSRGPERIDDYEVVPAAAGGVNTTPRDMARYLAALLGGGSNDNGSVLQPSTLRMMFEPQFQPDPRVPGMGLGFFRADLGGHLAVEHDGILPGFDAQICVAPDDGVAVMAFANGARGGMHWLASEGDAVLRSLIGVPVEAIRADVPPHPEIWPELCGWYQFSASPSDPGKLALGPGVEVFVRAGRLRIRALSIIPALYRGFELHPDDEGDPYAFRIAFPWFGVGTGRVVFTRKPGAGVTAVHTSFGPLTFEKRPGATNPRRYLFAAGLAAAAGVAAVTGIGAKRASARRRS
jgi:CubicO group peptidase (beta-lactamase class C family)